MTVGAFVLRSYLPGRTLVIMEVSMNTGKESITLGISSQELAPPLVSQLRDLFTGALVFQFASVYEHM